LDILEGLHAGTGRSGDVERLEDLCHGIAGNTFCPMGDALIAPILGTLKYFRDEFEAGIVERSLHAVA
jgi:NADH-quinone oxidoreductase subunit F